MRVELLGVASNQPNNNTIEAYAKALGFEYKVPTVEEAIERDKEWELAYKKNITLAQQSVNSNDFHGAVDYYYKALESNGHTKTEDYVELARLLSISNHENMSSGFYFLIKAAIRGWERISEFDTNEDFKNIKLTNAENWMDLMNVVNELRINKS